MAYTRTLGTPESVFAAIASVAADVSAVATSSGALTTGRHNPVDASGGAKAMTLADATAAGQVVSVEKTDSSTNAVAVTLNLRGTPGSTLSLVWQNESIELRSKADGSWWPVAGHKTKASLDNAYVQTVPPATGVAATDTAAVQAAHDALPSGGGEIRLRSGGTYAFTSTGVTFTKKVALRGLGTGRMDSTAISKITCSQANSTAITISSDGCTIEDLAIINSPSADAASGAGIRVTAGTQMHVRRVFIYNFYDNLRFEGGHYWSVEDSTIYAPVRYGIFQANSEGVDSGDCRITGNIFDVAGGARTGSSASTAAVRWESGGGLRLAHNKVNGSSGTKFAYGFDFATVAGATTVDIFIDDNSIENIGTTSIRLAGQDATSTVNLVKVRGNEFLSTTTAIQLGAGFGHGIVSENIISGATTGISILANAGPWTIGTNRYKTISGSCVQVASGASSDIRIAPQHLNGDGTILTDSSTSHAAVVADFTYRRTIEVTTSGTVTLYALGLPGTRAGILTVTVTGVAGSSPFAIQQARSWVTDASNNVTLTTVGTDLANGTGSGVGILAFATYQGGMNITWHTSAGQDTTVATVEIAVKGKPSIFKVGG